MLNVALAGLLAGSLLTGGPDDRNKDRDKAAPADAAVQAEAPALGYTLDLDAEAPRSLTADTYNLGYPSPQAPIKLWVQYARGTVDGVFTPNGNDVDFPSGTEIILQRIGVGAQLNFLNFTRFQLGVGGQLNVAQNQLSTSGGNQESNFGLQNVKVYGIARGNVVGIHGGYIFDLGDEGDATTLANSDQRNAITGGLNFDYPARNVRLFGAVDYTRLLQGGGTVAQGGSTVSDQGDDFLNFVLGAGLKVSFFEIGAAAQIVTRFQQPLILAPGTQPGIGGHARMISPYLRISPPVFPASLFVRGAVLDEYTEYGFALDGANTVRPRLGFTAGISVGFE